LPGANCASLPDSDVVQLKLLATNPPKHERGKPMIRKTLLALAATAGLVGTTELGTNQAQANTHITFGIYGGYRPRYYRPIVVAPVVVRPIAPAPIIYAPATPVYVTTVI